MADNNNIPPTNQPPDQPSQSLNSPKQSTIVEKHVKTVEKIKEVEKKRKSSKKSAEPEKKKTETTKKSTSAETLKEIAEILKGIQENLLEEKNSKKAPAKKTAGKASKDVPLSESLVEVFGQAGFRTSFKDALTPALVEFTKNNEVHERFKTLLLSSISESTKLGSSENPGYSIEKSEKAQKEPETKEEKQKDSNEKGEALLSAEKTLEKAGDSSSVVENQDSGVLKEAVDSISENIDKLTETNIENLNSSTSDETLNSINESIKSSYEKYSEFRNENKDTISEINESINKTSENKISPDDKNKISEEAIASINENVTKGGKNLKDIVINVNDTISKVVSDNADKNGAANEAELEKLNKVAIDNSKNDFKEIPKEPTKDDETSKEITKEPTKDDETSKNKLIKSFSSAFSSIKNKINLKKEKLGELIKFNKKDNDIDFNQNNKLILDKKASPDKSASSGIKGGGKRVEQLSNIIKKAGKFTQTSGKFISGAGKLVSKGGAVAGSAVSGGSKILGKTITGISSFAGKAATLIPGIGKALGPAISGFGSKLGTTISESGKTLGENLKKTSKAAGTSLVQKGKKVQAFGRLIEKDSKNIAKELLDQKKTPSSGIVQKTPNNKINQDSNKTIVSYLKDILDVLKNTYSSNKKMVDDQKKKAIMDTQFSSKKKSANKNSKLDFSAISGAIGKAFKGLPGSLTKAMIAAKIKMMLMIVGLIAGIGLLIWTLIKNPGLRQKISGWIKGFFTWLWNVIQTWCKKASAKAIIITGLVLALVAMWALPIGLIGGLIIFATVAIAGLVIKYWDQIKSFWNKWWPTILAFGIMIMTAYFSLGIMHVFGPWGIIVAAVVALGLMIWQFKDKIWGFIKKFGSFLLNALSWLFFWPIKLLLKMFPETGRKLKNAVLNLLSKIPLVGKFFKPGSKDEADEAIKKADQEKKDTENKKSWFSKKSSKNDNETKPEKKSSSFFNFSNKENKTSDNKSSIKTIDRTNPNKTNVNVKFNKVKKEKEKFSKSDMIILLSTKKLNSTIIKSGMLNNLTMIRMNNNIGKTSLLLKLILSKINLSNNFIKENTIKLGSLLKRLAFVMGVGRFLNIFKNKTNINKNIKNNKQKNGNIFNKLLKTINYSLIKCKLLLSNKLEKINGLLNKKLDSIIKNIKDINDIKNSKVLKVINNKIENTKSNVSKAIVTPVKNTVSKIKNSKALKVINNKIENTKSNVSKAIVTPVKNTVSKIKELKIVKNTSSRIKEFKNDFKTKSIFGKTKDVIKAGIMTGFLVTIPSISIPILITLKSGEKIKDKIKLKNINSNKKIVAHKINGNIPNETLTEINNTNILSNEKNIKFEKIKDTTKTGKINNKKLNKLNKLNDKPIINNKNVKNDIGKTIKSKFDSSKKLNDEKNKLINNLNSSSTIKNNINDINQQNQQDFKELINALPNAVHLGISKYFDNKELKVKDKKIDSLSFISDASKNL